MMKKDTLYLHVGWSKTGTSAVQSQIQAQHEDFLAKGILYPQSLQWPDHSHHPFALSFKGSGVYQSDMTPSQALDKLRLELEASKSQNVLLSSELSPVYFNNPKFKEFVENYFKQVKVIFTVRPQSELLLSLFNQLVKDPNVRYGATIFTLAMKNIPWLNYMQHIRQWEKHVGISNMHVIPYSRGIVQDFLNLFDVSYKSSAKDLLETNIINPSLPTRCLPLVQKFGRGQMSNSEFMRRRDKVVTLASTIDNASNNVMLFSVSEQQAFDSHFNQGNNKLVEVFDLPLLSVKKSNYTPIMALSTSELSLRDLA